MITALYYPHIQVRSTGLLKTALLLWDRLEYIVPPRRSIPAPQYPQRAYAEAFELIGHAHTPTTEERRRAHTAVEELLTTSPPRTFLETALKVREAHYLIYPQKFVQHTWNLLKRHGLAQYDDPSADYEVPPALGLLMMSLLADQCAGTQKQKVTDRGAAYAWVFEEMANRLGGTYVTGLDASSVGTEYDRLVTICIVLVRSLVPCHDSVSWTIHEESPAGDGQVR